MEKLNKLLVVIPLYNLSLQFVKKVENLVKRNVYAIIIRGNYNLKFQREYELLSSLNGVVILNSQCKNFDRGTLLKEGYKYIINHFNSEDIIVTCDEFFEVEELFNLYNYNLENINSLVLGSRDFSLKGYTKKQKFGNYIMRKLFKILYGENIYDIQTPIKAFSVEIAKKFIGCSGKRFNYEINLLVSAHKNHIDIMQIPLKHQSAVNYKCGFKEIKDSLLNLLAIIKNLNIYIVSSILSAVSDILIFAIISMMVFKKVNALNTLIATISARLFSSIINLLLNYKMVFNGRSKKSIVKYYFLWLLQLLASYSIVSLFKNAIGWNLVVVKALVDLVLAVISYQIQSNWVFKENKQGEFYGLLLIFSRWAIRLFSKKYNSRVVKRKVPVVYVCRHLNMHGPYTTLKWLPFEVHPMVINKFFDKKSCYNHLSSYTFSVKKGKKAKRFSLKTSVCSWFIPKIIHSIKAIPVFRGEENALPTFKKAMEYLLKGESIIVYPDIDYMGNYSSVSDIYEGFLFLSVLYKKKRGLDLKFIPLFIDDINNKIIEREEIILSDYKNQIIEVKEKIIKEINVKKTL